MGITIREILESRFFENYEIIAGKNGINKEIQGVTVLDAPDGYKWTKKMELVITSGYVFKQDDNLFQQYTSSEHFPKNSGLAIKLGRYIDTIPKQILDRFDQEKVPLISIPKEHSWMDIMNAINVLVMNKNIHRFDIGEINSEGKLSSTYESQKISKILGAIENEMNFPAMVYDPFSKEAHYSSPKFLNLAEDLKKQDFIKPSFDYMKETLCANLQMIRYRFVAEKYKRPFSWINIPIIINKEIKAYFILLEAQDLIDYFDEFAIRTGFLLLQSLYEQIYIAKRIGETGFEQLIKQINDHKIKSENVKQKAIEVGLSTEKHYQGMLIKSPTPVQKAEIETAIEKELGHTELRTAFIDKQQSFILYSKDIPIKTIQNLQKRLELEYPKIKIALSDIKENLDNIDKIVNRSKKALEIGNLMQKDRNIFKYTTLGPLAWITIDKKELEQMKKELEPLINHNQKDQLLETLKTYLEQNLNYSLTAEAMYIHINTVRKRIEKIGDIIKLDLDNPQSRLKLEILLQLIT